MRTNRVSRGQFFAAVVAVVALAAGTARAEEQRNEEWSIGVGVGTLFPSYQLVQSGSGSALVPASTNSSTPIVMSVERRLAPSLWLGLHADLVTASVESKPGDTTEDASATRVTAAVGLRYVLNPGALVEFSPLVLVGLVSSSSSTSSTTGGKTSEHTGSEIGPTAGLGFAVEGFLGRGISLRFSTLVLSLTSLSTTTEEKHTGQATDTTKGSSTTFGLTLTPTIELRLFL